MNTLEIPRRTEACHQCGIKLIRSNAYHSTLLTDTQGQKERHDFCSTCWEQSIAQESQPHQWHWRVKNTTPEEIPSPPKKSREVRALELLQSGTISPAEQYLLALLLVRKRYLLLRKELAEEGVCQQHFEITSSKKMLTIPKVALTKDDLALLQKALADKLNSIV